jgi:hypothetical protein
MDLDSLTEAVDGLVRVGHENLADGESVVALQRQASRLEALLSAAAASFEAAGAFADDGARSATAWVATKCRLPKGQVRRMLRRGRVLPSLPLVAAAWLDGDVGAAHVDAIASLRRPATEEVFARDEAILVEHATSLRFEHFERAISYWEQLADPDGTEVDAAVLRNRRDVWLTSSFGGMCLGQITLDPISGAIVTGELERLEQDSFEADWAAAREALGRDPEPYELGRTAGQRRADALVEMATRSRAAPNDGRRPAPLFSVLVGYETLHGRVCELAQGTVVSPGSLVPWLDQAVIERAVFEPPRRIEVSASARLFSGATRRAIELRDRECAHPFCDRGASQCQADHIVPFRLGGPTTQENGRLLCGFHNRLRNQRPPPAA